MPSQTSEGRALLFGLGAVMLWSTVATAFNLSLKFISPLQLVTVASVTSWFFLSGWLLVSGQMGNLLR